MKQKKIFPHTITFSRHSSANQSFVATGRAFISLTLDSGESFDKNEAEKDETGQLAKAGIKVTKVFSQVDDSEKQETDYKITIKEAGALPLDLHWAQVNYTFLENQGFQGRYDRHVTVVRLENGKIVEEIRKLDFA